MKKRFTYLAVAVAAMTLVCTPGLAAAEPIEEFDEISAPLHSGPQEEINYPAGMRLEEFQSLTHEEQFQLKESASPANEAEEVARILAPTATPFMDVVRSVGNDVEAVIAKYPDVHTRFEVSPETSTFTIQYFEKADLQRSNEYIAQLKDVFSRSGATVSFKPADYLLSANEQVVADLTSPEGEWGSKLRAAEVVGAPDPLGDGVVRIGVQGRLAAS